MRREEMKIVAAVLLIVVVFYKFVAIPAGGVFAFFLTRHLLRKRTSLAAAGIALAWTVAMFAPLVTPAQTFFAWYLALMITPPAPQFSLGALVAASVVGLASSGLAVSFNRK
jgi:hypothetical protein